MNREALFTIILIALGAIVVPVLLIWSADNLLALTLKTWIAAFFLLLLVRSVRKKKHEKRHEDARSQKSEARSQKSAGTRK